VQNTGDLPSIVKRPLGDRVSQHLLGIVAGEFNAAEQTAQSGGAVLDIEREALVRGEATVLDQLVEPTRSTSSDGELSGVGEQLGRCPHRLRLGLAVDGLSERGPLRIAGLEHSGQHGIRCISEVLAP
jgi:hypothetical protein